MKNYKNRISDRILIYLLFISVVIVFVHILLNFISIVIFQENHGFIYELSNRFDLNDENSVPQWLTQAIFLVISLSALLATRLTTKKQGSRIWLCVSILGLLMSIDDVATLHEFVLQSLHNTFFIDMTSTVFVNAWLILLPFILIGLGWLTYKAVKLLPKRTAIIIAMSGLIYIFGAIIIDSLTNYFAVNSFMEQGFMGGMEGGFQLLGSSMFLYAILDYLEIYYKKPISSAIASLKPTKRS